MKNIKQILLTALMSIFVVLGVIGIVWLAILNFHNPDFTELRMLIEFLPIYAGTGTCFVLAVICGDLLKD